MSVAQARGIVKGLKWHHLGFCFFWAVTFVALMAPADEFAFASTGFSVGKQLSTIVAVVVAATLSVRRGSKAFSPESAYIAGIALSAGSLLYYLAFFLADFSVASVAIASALVGASQGAFFVMWQSFYASEGTSRTTVYIPLSALCSVVLCIAIGFLPTEWLVVFAASSSCPRLALGRCAKALLRSFPMKRSLSLASVAACCCAIWRAPCFACAPSVLCGR